MNEINDYMKAVSVVSIIEDMSDSTMAMTAICMCIDSVGFKFNISVEDVLDFINYAVKDVNKKEGNIREKLGGDVKIKVVKGAK